MMRKLLGDSKEFNEWFFLLLQLWRKFIKMWLR